MAPMMPMAWCVQPMWKPCSPKGSMMTKVSSRTTCLIRIRIEARDWNLSAGQYKPFDFTQLRSDKSVVELIVELKKTEQEIIGGLDILMAMVEGQA